MQDNADLRNLVLQTLDTKGILSHLKAQVRASVYSVDKMANLYINSKKWKILESQDENIKKNAGFGLQNPVCQKLTETPDGICLFFKVNLE